MKRHIHLDLVGGLSGDMFISGMLDAFPEWQDADLQQVIVDAGFPDLVRLERADHDDGVLTGTRFRVYAAEPFDGNHHTHRHYREIRETIESSALDAAIKEMALAIFEPIAVVEAKIHGKPVDDVAFHEVGAWDSIADVLLAASLIVRAGAASWSVSPVPTGSGFVETAHGRLPVPVPATARLLEGFEMLDDGIAGERVTPTGAAILHYLGPARVVPPGFTMGRTGYGFGTKHFPGISNTVRVVRYEKSAAAGQWQSDRVCRLSFETDDQSPEGLAAGLERLRERGGVIDVLQQPYWGKKGRQGSSITVLATLADADRVVASIFSLTTTLGVRRELIERSVLERQEIIVHVGERHYRVKVARRPNGYTAKVEMDDLVAAGLGRDEQEKVRVEAERLALEQVK